MQDTDVCQDACWKGLDPSTGREGCWGLEHTSSPAEDLTGWKMQGSRKEQGGSAGPRRGGHIKDARSTTGNDSTVSALSQGLAYQGKEDSSKIPSAH